MTNALAYAALVASAAIWSGNAIIGRLVRDSISPAAMGFLQWSIGMAVLLPFVWSELVEKREVLRRDWKVLVVLGLFGTATFAAFALWSLRYSSATNYSLLNSTVPVWVMLVVWLRHGQRPTFLQAAGFAVSVAGVLVVLAKGEASALAGLHFEYGDLLVLGAMLMWSIYTALLNERPRELSTFAFIVAAGVVGLIVVGPLYAFEAAQGRAHIRFDAAVLVGILYLAIVRTIVATLTYNFGIGRVGPARGAPFVHLVPLFGAAAAWLILGERIELYHAAAFVLVVAGIYIAAINLRPSQTD